MVLSPFSETTEAILTKSIAASQIISEYKKRLRLDVSRFFKGIDQVGIYQCPKTGYSFYYPFNITGDGEFYKQLQQFRWYYMPFKWEHSYVKNKYIKSTDKVLEVGCGHGGFLAKLKEEGIDVTGLELNPDSQQEAAKNGVTVHLETVEDYAVNNVGKYDVVCSFQVLEHIQNVRSYIDASLALLKDNGIFIVSVPNNESFIKNHSFDILNMPPHHMGLWNHESLASLTDIFPLKLLSLSHEPLQEYHYKYYNEIMISAGEHSLTGKALSMALYPFTQLGIRRMAASIPGHTIVAVYRKLPVIVN